jgi:hypothetical protein
LQLLKIKPLLFLHRSNYYIFSEAILREVILLALGWTEVLALMGSVAIAILLIIYLTNLWGYDWEKLRDKFRSMGVKRDYQVELLIGSIAMGLVFVFASPVIGGMMRNLPALFGILVAVCYPLVVMFLRPVTFEKVLKIVPDFRIYRIFVIFSVFAGGYFTIAGFSSMNFNHPLGLSLTMIIVGLLGQTVPLLPDYIERITRFDLGMNRRWRMNNKMSQRALIFLGSLSFATFIILRFITESIQSSVFGI